MKKTLDQCKTANEFIHYAESHGGQVVSQSGSHVKIAGTQPGCAIVPNHHGDIPTGTVHSIIRMFKLIGILLIPTICILSILPTLFK